MPPRAAITGRIQRLRPDRDEVVDVSGCFHLSFARCWTSRDGRRGPGRRRGGARRPESVCEDVSACPPVHLAHSLAAARVPRASLAEPVDIILLAFNRVDYLSEMVATLERNTLWPYRLDGRGQCVRPRDEKLAASPPRPFS